MHMKRMIAAVVSMAMTCLMMPAETIPENIAFAETEIWDGTTDVSWYDAEETEFHISTAEELAGLSELVNAGHTMEGKTIYLDNDIYLNDVSNYDNWETDAPDNQWTPIGTSLNFCFDGVLEGQGRRITGAYASFSGGNALLSSISFFRITGTNAAIKDLNFDYTYMDASYSYSFSTTSQAWGAAGICVDNRGSITDCSFNGVIKWVNSYQGVVHDSDGSSYCGAICAWNDGGTISGCTVDGSMTVNIANREICVGGICGMNAAGNITKCRNKAQISSTADYYEDDTYHYVGGICGRSETRLSTMISDCCNYGDITAITQKYSRYNQYTDCAGICNVALVLNYSEQQTKCGIENCYNRGTITSDHFAGGIVGRIEMIVPASNLPSTANCTVKNTYNTGTISSGNGTIGGLRNWDDNHGTDTIESCYYLIDSALRSGVAKSASNMQKADFAESLGNAFVYSEGDYPLLAWEVGLQQAPLPGDVNLDGTFDLADIKLLQDSLIGRETLTAEQGTAADVYADHVLNGFDLSRLRGMYLEQSQTVS